MQETEKRSGSRWFLYTWLAFCALFIFMWIFDGTSERSIFISGGSLTTIAHHRHLLAALAAGDLTPVPNSNVTPRLPHGPDSYDVDDGEGLVLIKDSIFDIEGAADAAQTRSLRLFVPGEIYRDTMTLEFRNGQTDDGALMFVTNTSHAWNWTTIGYPFEGTVRLTRTGKSNIDAEFDVMYRCIGYVHRTSEGEVVHEGWEAMPEKECPQNLFPLKIRFGKGVFAHLTDRPEKLPYTGGAS